MPAESSSAGGEFEAARDLADDAFLRGELDEALKQLRTVLFRFEARLGPDARAGVYVRMGRIKAAQRDAAQARNLYEKALAIDATSRAALIGLVGLYGAAHDDARLVDALRALAEQLAREERLARLIEAGDVCVKRLGDVPRGVLLYQEALALDPSSKLTQLRLFEACRDAAMWPETIAACEGLLADEADAAKRATWRFFLATTYRDRIDDDEKALIEFEKVLDEDPDDRESGAAIEALHTANEDWAGLEASWLRHLARLEQRPGTESRRETLLHALGEHARLRLHDLPRAAEYLARAVELGPGQRARRELLAGIYAQLPGRWADAIREHQRLLLGDPKRIESYRQMRGILRDAGRVDEVWCVCAALVQLGRADPTEVQFYELYRPQGVPGSLGTLGTDGWPAGLYHPDEDRVVSRVAEGLAPVLGRCWAQDRKEFGLRKQELQDAQTSPLALAKALRVASAVLGGTLPELYVVPHQPGGLIFAVTDPPATVAGQDFLAGLSPVELRFAAAHHVAAYRPEHYVAYLVSIAATALHQEPPETLAAFLAAAVALAVPDAVIERTAAVEQAIRTLQPKLTPDERERLRPAAEELAARPAPPDLAVWLCSAELTSDRAGLLLCGDLTVAARMLPRVPALSPELNEGRRIEELLCFAVSAEFFELRRTLGVALAGE